MKWIYLILLLSSTSFCRAQNSADAADPGLQVFIGQFMSAARHHHTDSLMLLMDPAYRMEQHDRFLRGNTKQFLNEIFCGNITDGSGFKCVKYKKVKFVQLASLGQGEKNIPVVFRVRDKKTEVDVILTIAVRIEDGTRMYGIVGGVG